MYISHFRKIYLNPLQVNIRGMPTEIGSKPY